MRAWYLLYTHPPPPEAAGSSRTTSTFPRPQTRQCSVAGGHGGAYKWKSMSVYDPRTNKTQRSGHFLWAGKKKKKKKKGCMPMCCTRQSLLDPSVSKQTYLCRALGVGCMYVQAPRTCTRKGATAAGRRALCCPHHTSIFPAPMSVSCLGLVCVGATAAGLSRAEKNNASNY